MDDVIFAINQTIAQFPTGLVQSVNRSRTHFNIYLDGDYDDYEFFMEELCEKVIPLGFDVENTIQINGRCTVQVFADGEYDSSFVDTLIRVTPSFHDFEDESEFPYRRDSIGTLFHFSSVYDRFVRIDNNTGKFEQAGTGLMFKIHFGDAEIGDAFQNVLESCKYEVVDRREE
ncbi:MAG: hypothetical protein IJP99_10610 [Methanobrevibacter sp.]|nr:hypothetical protein [Methanobrevibacter sp.]MBR0059769.1 hypothetical protein [Methanobrevibacter sp.]